MQTHRYTDLFGYPQKHKKMRLQIQLLVKILFLTSLSFVPLVCCAVSLYAFSNGLQWMKSNRNHRTFPHCVSSTGLSSCLAREIWTHTGCTYSPSCHCCGFLNAWSIYLLEMMRTRIGYIHWASRHCVFSCASSDGLHERRSSCNGHTYSTFHHCVSNGVSLY